jgi:hypothetical protein
MRTEFEANLKQNNYKEIETIKERGKKRFQERLAEEKEAEREIKEFDPEDRESDVIDSDEHPTIS